MSATIVDLCENIVAYIAGNVYSFPFDLERKHIAFVRLEDKNTTQVYVYPVSLADSVETREASSLLAEVAVHVVNYVETNTDAEIDRSLELEQQIRNSLRGVVFDDGWQWIAFASEFGGAPVYQLEGLTTRNVFHTPIAARFVRAAE